MPLKYTISWHVRVTRPRVERRKWWAFWEHDRVFYEDVWVRRYAFLDEAEAERVRWTIARTMTDPACRALTAIMSAGSKTGELYGLQLEAGAPYTEYVKTEAPPCR